MTASTVEAANYPFCTIDPNNSRVAVPGKERERDKKGERKRERERGTREEETYVFVCADERYDYLVDFFKPKSEVPAFLQITDIAGLVKGEREK